jgi:C1A family cysteine protease
MLQKKSSTVKTIREVLTEKSLVFPDSINNFLLNYKVTNYNSKFKQFHKTIVKKNEKMVNLDGTTLNIENLLHTTNCIQDNTTTKIPSEYNIRNNMPPVLDQGNLGSCVFNAFANMINHYYYNSDKSTYKYRKVSRLFVYYLNRRLFYGIDTTNDYDTGAMLTDASNVIKNIGFCPEIFHEYNLLNTYDDNIFYKQEPSKLAYSIATKTAGAKFKKFDYFGVEPAQLIKDIIDHLLTNKSPIVFGIYIYYSMLFAKNGEIPFPIDTHYDDCIGAHALTIVGYDDNKVISHPFDASETVGAFLILNSWGIEWGDAGYGWVPYEFILSSSYNVTPVGLGTSINPPLIHEIFGVDDPTPWLNGVIFDSPYDDI